jgi:ankyrin repeat protein
MILDYKVCSTDGLSLLSASILAKNVSMVRTLLNHGESKVTAEDLQWAIMSPGYVSCQEMAILLISKASPDVINGKCLLEWATAHNNVELVQYLLAAGAKVPTVLIRRTLLQSPTAASMEANVRQMLRRAIMEPHSLAHLSRMVVRRVAFRKASDIESLLEGLPGYLKDFLGLKSGLLYN